VKDIESNRMLKILGEDLYNVYTSPDITRVINIWSMRWAGHVAHMGEMRNAFKVLLRKPKGKRAVGKHNRRWDDNIKINLKGGVMV
jgi:hypothetical protein